MPLTPVSTSQIDFYVVQLSNLTFSSLHRQEGQLGPEVDQRPRVNLRFASGCLRCCRGYLLLRLIRLHLLAEEAWPDAWSHFLQRADLS